MLLERVTSLHRSTSFRLISIFVLVIALSTAAVVALLYEQMEQHLEQQANAFIDELITDYIQFESEFGFEGLEQEITESISNGNPSREFYVLFDENCRVIVGETQRILRFNLRDQNICAELENLGDVIDIDIPTGNIEDSSSQLFGFSRNEGDDAVAKIQRLRGGGWLFLAIVIPEVVETRHFFISTLIFVSIFMLTVGFISAYVLTASVNHRLERINAMSRDIRDGDLTRRIPLDGSGDEFESLSMNLNSMLDRIESVLEGSRQVTNDIAHDLRTPLTRIQTHIEFLRSVPELHSQQAAYIDKISQESEQLIELFNSLLNIAGVEAGRAIKSFQTVNISNVCDDSIELLEPMASERNVSFDNRIESDIYVTGDKNLLFQALTNIVENAIKYTKDGSSVIVTISRRGNECELRVIDFGSGIPISERENVFKRFYRLESHRGSPGYGLGLSLVKAIVELHGGKISLKGDSNGLEVEVVFELAKE